MFAIGGERVINLPALTLIFGIEVTMSALQAGPPPASRQALRGLRSRMSGSSRIDIQPHA